MTVSTTSSSAVSQVAIRLTLTGLVQGIGLRPAVARLARQLSLAGFVGNTPAGVEIHVEGATLEVERFQRELASFLPAAAKLASCMSSPVAPQGYTAFSVGQSPNMQHESSERARHPLLSARVPADAAVCENCLGEVNRKSDRRYEYPFASCTDCGPRYSIIEQMPYERARTGMAAFSLCEECRREYGSDEDRRFHAQTNACPACGPQVWLRGPSDSTIAAGSDALQAAAKVLLEGRILALRGLGGYQLLVDATSQDAVERLRLRKERRGKPLAVLAASLAEANKLARLDAAERELLCSSAGPIVVGELRAHCDLAPSVTAGLHTVGIMLPTTPLHALIANAVKRPLVCTSGNMEGNPLAYQADDALKQLKNLADAWLEHDRPIVRPIDDSVVRVMAGRPAAIRLGRGYAPLSLSLESDMQRLALGGHQKTSLALSNSAQSVLGPHLGDLNTVAARQRYHQQASAFAELYGAGPFFHVCDQHPQYFTTEWARSQAGAVMQVQHHHAHIVAGMIENGWLDRQVLGISFDGTGYGTDGTIWGGEFLVCTAEDFQRVGYLRPFPLPGGEVAVREPWRIATALVREAAGDEAAERLNFQCGKIPPLLSLLQRPRLSPITTSAGRLFDGAAALILDIEQCQFEGEAAMLLEAACDFSEIGAYEIPITGSQPKQLDWRPLIRGILQDRASGISPGAMAMRFHRGLAAAIEQISQSYSTLPVVLGGGVFQNRVLVELLAERFGQAKRLLGLPGMIPTNDGGLAAGQLAVALARTRRRNSCV